MRNNNDFKKLVLDKHKKMISDRKMKRKRILTAASCLLVCFVVCTITINSDLFKTPNVLDKDQTYGTTSDGLDSPKIESSPTIDNSAETEDGHNSLLGTNSETDPNSGSVDGSNGSNTVETIPPINSDGNDVNFDKSESENSNKDHECDDRPSESPTPPQITFIPDDYPIITGTVDLMADYRASYPEDPDYEMPNMPDEPNAPSDSPSEPESPEYDKTKLRNGLSDFSFNLFRNTYKYGENNVISPASLFYSLAMVSNGAQGNTKTELDNVLCGGDSNGLNDFLSTYCYKFGYYENSKTSIDSAIWYADNVTVNKEFLQTNYDYYGADAYKTIMNNDEALNSINGWIEKHTNGLIKEMIKDIDPSTSMILANTVYFEASWKYPLKILPEKQEFTNTNGTKTDVEMMSGTADKYIENEYCTGFAHRYYGSFSFVALLPNSGMSTLDVINSLDSKCFYGSEFRFEYVDTKFILPKFECTNESSLVDALKAMGIKDAFTDEADFTAMIKDEGIMIDEVNHNVTISVNENGTLAAAATEVGMAPEGVPGVDEPECKSVVLNRPFVYIIYDNSSQLPVFIGTVENF